VKPDVIFLDAVGTLFGVQGGVGQIYSRFASEAGISVAAAAVNRAFIRSFRAAPRMAFPNVERDDIPEREYQWWKAIAVQTFTKAGVIGQFNNFETFFRPLYDYFAQASAWCVYDDVPVALAYWQSMGIRLGVISNFDSRLYPVLEALNLSHFFDSVTISTEVGVAKPDVAIFHYGLRKYNCHAARVWHIGDSYEEDYQGAKAAGINGIWLYRDRELDEDKAKDSSTSVSNLMELIETAG
jgi:putative hydrolase of the HAD superfamily